MNFLKQNWYLLLAVVFLLGSFGDWTYSYYQILRWVVTGAAVYVAYISYSTKKLNWAWIFGIIAVIFNPFFPFHFDREVWQILDVIAAITIGSYACVVFLKRK